MALVFLLTACSASGPKVARFYEGEPRVREQVALLETDPDGSVFVAAINGTEIFSATRPDYLRPGSAFELLSGKHTLKVIFHSRFASGGAIELEFEAQSGRTYLLLGSVEKEDGVFNWTAQIIERPTLPTAKN